VFGNRVKISTELWERLNRVAASAGYSSTEEFVFHVLEKASVDLETSQSEEEVRKRLQGLGYLE